LNSVDDNVHSVSKSLYIRHGVSNLLEQKFRFGLVLCRLVVLKKKIWANNEQLLRTVFSCCHRQKKLFF
jgi:hypothetical protein